MISKEYACAYREVIELLKYMPIQEVYKIPKQKLQYYLNHMNREYNYVVDKNKNFEEQKKLEITEAIFATLFRDYWATPYQRERIIKKEEYDRKIDEMKKQEKWDKDIFQTRKKDKEEEKEIIPYQKKIVTRIIRWLKRKRQLR